MKEPGLTIEKMVNFILRKYSNLINNLSNDLVNFKNIRKDTKREKSNEKYHSAGSSADSVITFTEKKNKRTNRSMENKNEKIMNSSIMDLKEDCHPETRKILNNRLKKITNNLYIESQKKKEKINKNMQEKMESF